jgi:D-sedoheptulose 7-phosphate isomerase
VTEAARFAAMMEEGAVLRRRLATEAAGALVGVVDACEAAIRGGGRLFFCGNGGSAADAQHLATELLVRLRSSVERPSWPAIALTLDPTVLTAGGNDYGFEEVFARPLSGLGRAGDVLFGITTSGKSPNVLRALETARGMGIATVGLLGGDGGPARTLCDHVLLVPSTVTARIQEAHIALGHAVMELLEDRLVRA